MVSIQFLLVLLASGDSGDLDRVEMAAAIKNGDKKAFRTFFDRHHEALIRYLLSRGMELQAAEDLVQQAFLYIWEHRNDIDEQKSLRAYIFKIAYTRMLNWIRDHKKMVNTHDFSGEFSTVTPGDHVQHAELVEAIEAALGNMPKQRRMVFEFCFLQEFTYRETADAMEISRKTVENHMGLALKDIRAALKNFE